MANTYFQFKQFTIHQDQTAMKVCTDACILGAWFAEKIPSYSTVLDIGSGSGLLMLMLAQKSKAKIFGIEMDLPSCKQSKENITGSRWSDRLKVFPGDARTYSFTDKFDFIISNPPFFEGDLLSPVEERNIARHSTALTLEELVNIMDLNLDVAGSFGILLPFHRTSYFESLATKKNFFLKERLLVKQNKNHHFFRSILHFSRKEEINPGSFELIIHTETGHFSSEFIELMRDYYLYL